MQVTAEMLREVYRQTQREVLAEQISFEERWERMADLLNKNIATRSEASTKRCGYCANYEDCHHSGVHRCPGCGRYFCEACYALFLDVLPYGAVNGMYPRLPAPICPQCHYARFGQAHEGQAR